MRVQQLELRPAILMWAVERFCRPVRLAWRRVLEGDLVASSGSPWASPPKSHPGGVSAQRAKKTAVLLVSAVLPLASPHASSHRFDDKSRIHALSLEHAGKISCCLFSWLPRSDEAAHPIIPIDSQ